MYFYLTQWLMTGPGVTKLVRLPLIGARPWPRFPADCQIENYKVYGCGHCQASQGSSGQTAASVGYLWGHGNKITFMTLINIY